MSSRNGLLSGRMSATVLAGIGLLVSPVSFGFNAKLSWDANSEPDLAGYKLYYGPQSRGCTLGPLNEDFLYDGVGARQGNSPIVIFLEDLDDASAPSYRLDDLADGTDFAFAVTAFNTSGSESLYSNEASKVADIWAPTVCHAGAPNQSQVTVVFNEFMDYVSAGSAANYTLSYNGGASQVSINSVTFDFVGWKQVTLSTAPLVEGTQYTLEIANVFGYFDGNPVAAGTQEMFTYSAAPHIRRVETLNHRSVVEVEFSEDVDPATSQALSNYAVDNGISLSSSSLAVNLNSSDNERTVHLTSSPHVEGTSYTLTVNNVADRESPANVIASDSMFVYTHPVDATAPLGMSAHLTNSFRDRSKVYVTFSEDMDYASASNPANYSIDGGMSVTGASLYGDGKTVVLDVSPHPGGSYQLTVAGVVDNAAAANAVGTTGLSYDVPSLADMTRNWNVDSLDLGVLMSGWGQAIVPAGTQADLDADGSVGAGDLQAFLPFM